VSDHGAGETRFPVYIPTRGRPEVQKTAGRLLELGIHPVLVVEDAEHDAYAAANPECEVVVWPASYMDDYERTPELDPHPTTGAAHNFAWDHSRERGFTHHWIMDDNIQLFRQRRGGKAYALADAAPFRWHEAVMLRYRNLAGFALGLSHTFGSPQPFTLNTRLYCAVLYRNDLHESGIRWRRGLNDDTVVSLDILKTGYWCTAESHLLWILKQPTNRGQRIAGGMTDFYNVEGGFIKKAAEAVRLHPDCVKMANRYGRVHHQIDYSQFKQRLIPVDAPAGA
jgi:hypothetical protein